MIKTVFLIVALVSSTSAFAQARQSTTTLTCAAAAELVQRSGAVVLSTGEGTYDRYVSSQQYCSAREHLRHAWAKTRDKAECVLGYTCGGRDSSSSR